MQCQTEYGNKALLGGDSVLGGCLSNCSIDHEINKSKTVIDKTEPNNTFWTLVSTGKPLSQSTIVEYPTGARFCMNRSTHANDLIICNKSHTVSVFRGQTFNVPVIARDELCYPTHAGYTTYISTWMQFIFPLYIWVLILIIVFASWYSTVGGSFGNGRQLDHQLEFVPNSTRTRNLMSMLSRNYLSI